MVEAFKTLVPSSTAQADEHFSLHAKYLKDTDPLKVNLGIGVYRTDEDLPWVLPIVDEVEKSLFQTRTASRHEYLPIQGDLKFLELARDLVFDLENEDKEVRLRQQRIASVQTISGTGANHIGAAYLSDVLKPQHVWLPDPTWGNHHTIWDHVGVDVRLYPYYDEKMGGINIDSTMRVLKDNALPGDVVLFHACAHNPTGSDPSRDEWWQLINLCRSRGLVPFLDTAYQGFATGSVKEDAWVVKAFLNEPELEFCVAQSFSKNFGLYGQRVGALHIVVNTTSIGRRDNVLTKLNQLVRSEYSMSPRAGSEIVRSVLDNSSLRDQWQRDLYCMSERLKSMRQALYNELTRLSTPGSWTHITQQVGMFSYTGLTRSQVLALRRKHHVYMLDSGRMSMSGVTLKNVSYIAKAYDDVVRNS